MPIRLNLNLRQIFGGHGHNTGHVYFNLHARDTFNTGPQYYQRYHQPLYSSTYAASHNLPHPNLQQGGYNQQQQPQYYVDSADTIDAYNQHKSRRERNPGQADDDLAASYEMFSSVKRGTSRFDLADRLYQYADNCPKDHPNRDIITDALRSTNLDGDRLKDYDRVITQANEVRSQKGSEEASAFIRHNLVTLNNQWRAEDGRGASPQPQPQGQQTPRRTTTSAIQTDETAKKAFDQLSNGKSDDKSALVTLVQDLQAKGVKVDQATIDKLAQSSDKSFVATKDVTSLAAATDKFLAAGGKDSDAMAVALRQAVDNLQSAERLTVTSIKPTNVAPVAGFTQDPDIGRKA